MKDKVYIKFDLSAKVHKKHVTVGDVAKVYCQNNHLSTRIRATQIYVFHNPKQNRVVYSAVKVIEIICQNNPTADISHIGEPDFVLEYEPLQRKCLLLTYLNVLLCSLIMFFGSALAIMTFNTDVSIAKLFSDIYQDITGHNNDGFTILELTYSIGVGVGIIVFYNHFGKKRITKDPTPIELEIRTYETEIKNALINGVNNKEEHIDVD